jgi:hypothetical protein
LDFSIGYSDDTPQSCAGSSRPTLKQCVVVIENRWTGQIEKWNQDGKTRLLFVAWSADGWDKSEDRNPKPTPCGFSTVIAAPGFGTRLRSRFLVQDAGRRDPHKMNKYLLALIGIPFVWTISVSGKVLHVDLNSANPLPPFSDWSTAATNIQDAVDMAMAGDQVMVLDGVYQIGGRAVFGLMTNRVAVTKPLTVQSVNGPSYTTIRGYQVTNTVDNDGAIRCVYLADNACLSGFTLVSGATRRSGNSALEQSGGGLWCESQAVIVSNCVIVGNSAYFRGGGALSGTLINCVLSNNSAYQGGGVNSSVLNNCVLDNNSASEGGGAWYGRLNRCRLMRNVAWYPWPYDAVGGGAYVSTLDNCTLMDNSAGLGGGANSCALNNCTLVRNSGSIRGGGAYASDLKNSIIYYNASPDKDGIDHYFCSFDRCCTTPSFGGFLPGGNSFTNAPIFTELESGDLHLHCSSPCINAGDDIYAAGVTDGDGNPRIVGSAVDVGAYEFPSPSSIISAAASPDVLWPPNRRMVEISISAQLENGCSPEAWEIDDVSGSEPAIITGKGNNLPDWIITSQQTVLLRAKRSPREGARIYSISIKPSGRLHGGPDTRIVTVVVPKSRSSK